MVFRAFAAPLLVLVLLVPVTAGTDANPQSPLNAGARVTQLAISGDDGFVGASNTDPGTPTSNPNAIVWHLWNSDGAAVQAEPADHEDCGAVLRDCDSDALGFVMGRVAADNGYRFVIATEIEPPIDPSQSEHRTFLTFATEAQGSVADMTVRGRFVDMALSDNGNRIVVLTEYDDPETFSTDIFHQVLVLDWGTGGAVTQRRVSDIEASSAGRAIDISADGKHWVVLLDKQYWYEDGITNPTVYSANAASPQRLDFSASSNHRLVTGYNTGDLMLFNDAERSAPSHRLKYGDGNTPVTAVAARTDGLMVAGGYSDGSIRYFQVEPGTERLTRLETEKPTTVSVSHLAWSHDGRYLAATSGHQVFFYHAEADGLSLVWSHAFGTEGDRPTLSGLAIDNEGERVAVSHGSLVVVFAPIHDVVATVPQNIFITAGESKTIALEYSNDGNRVEDVALTVDFPTGWFVTATPSSFQFAPGETQDVEIRIIVPEMQAPDRYGVSVAHSLANGQGETAIDVEVPTLRKLRLTIPSAVSFPVEPGQAVDVPLIISNLGNDATDVEIAYDFTPPSWNIVITPDQFSLEPGAESTATARFEAPGNAAEGDSARLHLVVVGAPGQEANLTAVVGADFGVSLVAPLGLKIGPGGAAEFNVTVNNDGNAPDTFDLTIGSTLPSDWKATFPSGLTMAEANQVPAGQSIQFKVIVQAPATADPDSTVALGLNAASRSDPLQVSARTVLVTVDEALTPPPETTTTPGKNGPAAPLLLVALALVGVAAWHRRQ